jgi:hypothetical protein
MARADMLSDFVVPNFGNIESGDAQQASDLLLGTALLLETPDDVTGWVLSPSPSGAYFCDSGESVSCLRATDLISRRITPPQVKQEGLLRNNLPEPATLVMLGGGATTLDSDQEVRRPIA